MPKSTLQKILAFNAVGWLVCTHRNIFFCVKLALFVVNCIKILCNSFFGSSEQIDFCFNGFNQAGFMLIDKETRGREIRWKKPKLPVNDREKWRNRAVCERKEMQLNKKSAESGCQSLSALFCC